MRSRRIYRAVAGVAVLVLLLGACGDAGTPDPAPAPDPEPDQSIPEGPGHELADGETFAWVKGITGDGLLVDPAELLSGEEARQAAVEDGVIGPDEDLPNDVYIRDPDDVTQAVVPSSDAAYSLLVFDEGGSPVQSEVSYDFFTAVLNGGEEASEVYGLFDGAVPATVTIDSGAVVKVVQVYLP